MSAQKFRRPVNRTETDTRYMQEQIGIGWLLAVDGEHDESTLQALTANSRALIEIDGEGDDSDNTYRRDLRAWDGPNDRFVPRRYGEVFEAMLAFSLKHGADLTGSPTITIEAFEDDSTGTRVWSSSPIAIPLASANSHRFWIPPITLTATVEAATSGFRFYATATHATGLHSARITLQQRFRP